jgi:hypothetical protein
LGGKQKGDANAPARSISGPEHEALQLDRKQKFVFLSDFLIILDPQFCESLEVNQ